MIAGHRFVTATLTFAVLAAASPVVGPARAQNVFRPAFANEPAFVCRSTLHRSQADCVYGAWKRGVRRIALANAGFAPYPVAVRPGYQVIIRRRVHVLVQNRTLVIVRRVGYRPAVPAYGD